MKKIILTSGFVFMVFYIFGQPGCIKRNVDYNIPDTCKVLFTDSGETKVSIVIENKNHFLYRKETTFSIFQNYLVKSEKSTKYLLETNAEGSSSYTLTFFEMPHYEKVFTCTKEADLFKPEGEIHPLYFLSKQIGCCEYSNYYELSTFPANEKFLSYHRNRFEIHAKSHDRNISKDEYVIYFGYDMCPKYLDTAKTVLGSLNYSINQKINGSVTFKKKSSKNSIGYAGYAPSKIQFMENGVPINDSFYHYGENSIIYSDNLNFIQNSSEINNIGIIVTFKFWGEGKDTQSYEKEYKIEFVNGEILQKEIIVE